MKDQDSGSTIRGVLRAASIVVVATPIALLQVMTAFVAPKKKDFFLNVLGKVLPRLAGVKLNKSDAKLAKGDDHTSVIYVANHQGYLDIPIMMGLAKGVLAGAPDIGWAKKFLDYIHVERPYKTATYMPTKEGATEDVINQGRNVIVFPEGGTADGQELLPIDHGVLLAGFFNEAAVMRDVVVQPVTIRVSKVNGQEVGNNQNLRDVFAWYGDQDFGKHIWRLLKTKSVDIDIDAKPVIHQQEYKDRPSIEIMETVEKVLSYQP